MVKAKNSVTPLPTFTGSPLGNGLVLVKERVQQLHGEQVQVHGKQVQGDGEQVLGVEQVLAAEQDGLSDNTRRPIALVMYATIRIALVMMTALPIALALSRLSGEHCTSQRRGRSRPGSSRWCWA